MLSMEDEEPDVFEENAKKGASHCTYAEKDEVYHVLLLLLVISWNGMDSITLLLGTYLYYNSCKNYERK